MAVGKGRPAQIAVSGSCGPQIEGGKLSATELCSRSSRPQERTDRRTLIQSTEVRFSSSGRCESANERGKMHDAIVAARKKVRACTCTCPCSPHAH
eukprot:1278278-Rhodomonas_salina.1